MDYVTDFLIVFCSGVLPVPVESVFIVHTLRKFYFAYKFSVYPKVSLEMLKKILESFGIYTFKDLLEIEFRLRNLISAFEDFIR
jgi:hypothetical protein